jgi:hypothetical protein
MNGSIKNFISAIVNVDVLAEDMNRVEVERLSQQKKSKMF